MHFTIAVAPADLADADDEGGRVPKLTVAELEAFYRKCVILVSVFYRKCVILVSA